MYSIKQNVTLQMENGTRVQERICGTIQANGNICMAWRDFIIVKTDYAYWKGY